MDKHIKFIFFLIIFSLAPDFVSLVFSQPPPPPPVPIPIDGGLSVLIVAGLGYAGKKLYSEGKNKKKI